MNLFSSRSHSFQSAWEINKRLQQLLRIRYNATLFRVQNAGLQNKVLISQTTWQTRPQVRLFYSKRIYFMYLSSFVTPTDSPLAIFTTFSCKQITIILLKNIQTGNMMLGIHFAEYLGMSANILVRILTTYFCRCDIVGFWSTFTKILTHPSKLELKHLSIRSGSQSSLQLNDLMRWQTKIMDFSSSWMVILASISLSMEYRQGSRYSLMTLILLSDSRNSTRKYSMTIWGLHFCMSSAQSITQCSQPSTLCTLLTKMASDQRYLRLPELPTTASMRIPLVFLFSWSPRVAHISGQTFWTRMRVNSQLPSRIIQRVWRRLSSCCSFSVSSWKPIFKSSGLEAIWVYKSFINISSKLLLMKVTLAALLMTVLSAVTAREEADWNQTLEGTSLKPYSVRDRVTVDGTLARYPYLLQNMEPRELASRVNALPVDLKYELYLATFTHFDNTTIIKCYRENSCRAVQDFKRTIDSSTQPLNNFYLVMFCRDELHHVSIKKYLRRNKISEPEFSQQLKKYHKEVVEMPGFLLSLDLASELQRNKFMVPDSYMLFGNWQDVLKEVQSGSQKYQWGKKISKVFWRGGDSGYSYNEVDIWSDLPNYFPRIELIKQSNLYPEKIDAELTYIYEPGVKENLTKLGLQSKISTKGRVTIEDHILYKYLISIDGWTTAWMRVPWILSSNSLLIKQDSKKVSWYDWHLIPNTHYFPVNNNLSNLVEVYKNLEQNQSKVKDVITEANKFAKAQFTHDKMFEELIITFSNYSLRQNITFSESTKLLMGYFKKPFEDFANLTDAQIEQQYKNQVEWKITCHKISLVLVCLIIAYAAIMLSLNFNLRLYLRYKWFLLLLSGVELIRGTAVADFIFKKKLAQEFLGKRTKNTQLSL